MALTTVRPQGMGFVTGRRNLIINGAMQVAQRGTSSADQTSAGYKTCDRWRVAITTQGTWTISQSSTTPNSDFSSSLKFDCTTADASPAASDQVAVETRLEAQDVAHLGYGNSDAKAITVSFWVRSNKTGTYTFEVFAQDPNRFNSTTYTIDSANTWEKKEITIPADTSGSGINSDSGIGLIVKWWLGAGSTFTGGTFTNNVWEANVNANRVSSSNVNLADSTDNEWYITGVQLEVGTNASDFEHRSFGEELSLCQRYCYVWVAENTYGNFANGGAITSSQARGTMVLPQVMRTQPSLTQNGTFRAISHGSGGTSGTVSVTLNRGHTHSPYVQVAGTGGTLISGRACELGADNDSDAELILSAEL